MTEENYNNLEPTTIEGIQYSCSLSNYHRVNPVGDNDVRERARKGAKSNLHSHSTRERINHRRESQLKAKNRFSHLGKIIDEFDIEED